MVRECKQFWLALVHLYICFVVSADVCVVDITDFLQNTCKHLDL